MFAVGEAVGLGGGEAEALATPGTMRAADRAPITPNRVGFRNHCRAREGPLLGNIEEDIAVNDRSKFPKISV